MIWDVPYVDGTWTPTVTLVGGTGNTVPQYTTNTGRYTRIGNRCYANIYLSGDGGNEGAGSGTLTIALPIAANASIPAGYIEAGTIINSTSTYAAHVTISGSTSVASLAYMSSATALAAATGALQNSTTRSISLQFWYEV